MGTHVLIAVGAQDMPGTTGSVLEHEAFHTPGHGALFGGAFDAFVHAPLGFSARRSLRLPRMHRGCGSRTPRGPA